MRSTKVIKICSSSLWTCLHHMVILRTRNKITDFLMILAWASPFKYWYCKLRIYEHSEKLSYRRFVVCIVQLIIASITPSLPSKNLAMNEGRNSLLERAQPKQIYRPVSYPMDNIISVTIIISDHTI